MRLSLDQFLQAQIALTATDAPQAAVYRGLLGSDASTVEAQLRRRLDVRRLSGESFAIVSVLEFLTARTWQWDGRWRELPRGCRAAAAVHHYCEDCGTCVVCEPESKCWDHDKGAAREGHTVPACSCGASVLPCVVHG